MSTLFETKIDAPVEARLKTLLRRTGFLKVAGLRSIVVQRHLCFSPLPPIRYRARIERTNLWLYLEFALDARAARKVSSPTADWASSNASVVFILRRLE